MNAPLAGFEQPLRFAARDNFAALDRVKNLDETLKASLERARALESLSREQQQLIARLLSALPVPNAEREVRIAQYRDCLALLEGRMPVPSPKAERAASKLHHTESIDKIKGVGPRVRDAFNEAGIATIEDLLRHLPRRLQSRMSGKLLDLANGTHGVGIGRVLTIAARSHGRRQSIQAIIGDGTSVLLLKWFRVAGGPNAFLERFARGRWVRAAGKVSSYGGRLQMVHPETAVSDEPPAEVLAMMRGTELQPSHDSVPVYAEIDGVRPSVYRRIVQAALPAAQTLPEPLPPRLLAKYKLPCLADCITALHEPPLDVTPEAYEQCSTPWHARLIYEEFLGLQIVVAQRRLQVVTSVGIAPRFKEPLSQTAQRIFPFALTSAQARALHDIERSMQSPVPMNRLVQGDVGSGKTAVALTAAVGVAQAGYQAALMAPTELLAEQHARTALKLLSPLGFNVVLLTGNTKAAERRRTLAEIENGTAHVIVGTHALIQDDVRYHRLLLAIIDEQHRFGVLQRARLAELARQTLPEQASPHTLVMTATPIPRTLALTVYGDLDLTVIDELPPGRSPIQTSVYRESQRFDAYAQVRRAVELGRQAYVVFPLVEQSDKEGVEHLRAATEAAAELQQGPLQGLRVGLLHGRVSADEKDNIMRAFLARELDVLVATTVIEVGIDVPNATVMVIEHAERFGLSQLHQLRGRVGRGQHQSECLLLASSGLSEDAWSRLSIMRQTNDGFRIAEEDLSIRGPGDFIGTRQSGLPELSMANLVRDQHWLVAAREDARQILGDDPTLDKPEHAGLKATLATFWRKRLALVQVG